MKETESPEEVVFSGEAVTLWDKSESEEQPQQEGGDNRWGGERKIRAKLQTAMSGSNPIQSTVTGVLTGFLDDGKYSFTAIELQACLNLEAKKSDTLLDLLEEKKKSLKKSAMLSQVFIPFPVAGFLTPNTPRN